MTIAVTWSTLRLKTGADLAQAWAEYAANAAAYRGVPTEVPPSVAEFIGVPITWNHRGEWVVAPNHDTFAELCHQLSNGAYRLFELGGELHVVRHFMQNFGFRITANGVEDLVGIVTWVRAADLPHPDDEDEPTETCARCAVDVPVDDIGAGQLCSWCTQLCR